MNKIILIAMVTALSQNLFAKISSISNTSAIATAIISPELNEFAYKRGLMTSEVVGVKVIQNEDSHTVAVGYQNSETQDIQCVEVVIIGEATTNQLKITYMKPKVKSVKAAICK